MKSKSRMMRLLALLATLALLTTACLGGDDGGGGDTAGEGGTEGGGGGQTVSVLGALVDTDEDALLESLAPWEEETGNTIQYEGSGDFETLINTRVQGGNPPDIALFPQPGLMANVNEIGGLQNIQEVLGEDFASSYQESVGEAIYDIGVLDDQLYGVLYRLNAKSFVWYPIPEFNDRGYSEPDTWSGMLELTDDIRENGEVDAPWCIGIESSGATGWVITDWFEDMMLAAYGPDVYDQWVNHEIPFNDDRVVQVGEAFAELAFTEGNVLGGRQAIVTTPFGDALNPMFEDPAACMMGKQAQFITSFFPEDIQENLPAEVDFFGWPQMDTFGDYEGETMLTAGDIASLLTESEAAQSLMEFMATPQAGEAWAASGGFISPHQEFDVEIYPNEIFASIAEEVQAADAVRFDGSDAMPASVGAGSFWTEMTAWVNGEKELEAALQAIEDSWPTE